MMKNYHDNCPSTTYSICKYHLCDTHLSESIVIGSRVHVFLNMALVLLLHSLQGLQSNSFSINKLTICMTHLHKVVNLVLYSSVGFFCCFFMSAIVIKHGVVNVSTPFNHFSGIQLQLMYIWHNIMYVEAFCGKLCF